MAEIYQGDILQIEGVNIPIYVVSKKFFNSSNAVIGCPIVKEAESSATHISVNIDKLYGTVLCEQIRFFDIKTRGYKYIGSSDLNTMIEIVDTVQGFFDFS
jgi:mRNA-degrading endonuclease toxin of MazEF toxin-antitoxin module